jgi:hypothetical protein
MSELKPYQKRMLIERDELNRKIYKLEQFVDAHEVGHDVFDNYQPGLSEAQLHAMKAYSAILDERIRVDGKPKASFPSKPGVYKDQQDATWVCLRLRDVIRWRKLTARGDVPISDDTLYQPDVLRDGGYVMTPVGQVDE